MPRSCAGCSNGDTAAFTTLVDRHAAACTRFAMRMLANREDAEDAVQESFLRAYRSLARYEERQAFRTWLFQILVNRCRTAAVRRQRRQRMFLVDDSAVASASVRPAAESTELRAELRRAIDALDPDQREAFLLKHVELLSYDENGGRHRCRRVGAQDAREASVRPNAVAAAGGERCRNLTTRAGSTTWATSCATRSRCGPAWRARLLDDVARARRPITGDDFDDRDDDVELDAATVAPLGNRRTRARRIVLRPLTGIAAAVAFVALGAGATFAALSWRAARSPGDASTTLVSAASPDREVVRFELAAPTASRVTLVGSFNEWNPVATPLRRDPSSGKWMVSLRLPPGRHVYAFVVDGDVTADPTAPRTADDDFGSANSVLLVGGRSS